VIPTELQALLNDPDPVRSQRVFRAMLQMQKLDIAVLRAAATG
jgi:predicted 3-demethylubiquinone-9 3-methyltransferase (glyoxalase superfamily)